jgi:hypothetical protein
MTTKLVQKHLLKGTREFEIVGDTVVVRSKAPMQKEEFLTVMLTVLNTEPVIRKSLLEFTSRVNNEPLLSLYLAKPNPDEFNAFVNLIKQKIQQEFNAFAGLKSAVSSAMQTNAQDEPPEFDTPDIERTAKSKEISAEAVTESIRMLSEYVGEERIGSFLAVLEAMQAEPQNTHHLRRMITEFEALGPNQGAVLSYAPYIGALLSDDPYENM